MNAEVVSSAPEMRSGTMLVCCTLAKNFGQERHLLVVTQGHLLAVKVTGAHESDQQGAKTLLKLLKYTLPTIKLL